MAMHTPLQDFRFVTLWRRNLELRDRWEKVADINDIVLIHVEDQPQAFARIESIEPDVKRDWYHVKLLILQVPLMVVTWILKNDYINGEIFTMEGRAMRLDLVQCPELPNSAPDTDDAEEPAPKKGKVISLNDLKKK